MAELSLKSAEEVRLSVTKQQQRDIREMYMKLAKQTAKEAEALKGKDDTGSILRQQYLTDMVGELNAGVEKISRELAEIIPYNMETVALEVVKDNVVWANSVGMGMKASYLHVANDIVTSVASGNVYKGDWTLSSALWTDVKNKQADINKIVAEGIAQNKSSYEIAKSLEQYVDPKAKKDWQWSKVYPGTAQTVDYNAQRLARTLVSHAYQQSLVAAVEKNPFVEGIRWRSAHTNRTCKLCNERDGTVYTADTLPLDHPNGLCTFISEIPETMDNIATRIAAWVQGSEDAALDDYAIALGARN